MQYIQSRVVWIRNQGQTWEIEEIEIHESEGETKCLMPMQWQRVTAKSQEGTALRADLNHADTVMLILI